MIKDSVRVPCDAEDHILSITAFELESFDEEPQFYASIFQDIFYARQSSIFQRWRERIKMSLFLLLGREYLVESVVVGDREYVVALRDFLNRHLERIDAWETRI